MKTEPNAKIIFNSWNGTEKDGVTKREQFALETLQSLIRRSPTYPNLNLLAIDAVIAADALIQELNKDKK